MNSYPFNIAINLTVAFTDDITGLPADPGVVRLRVINPANAVVMYSGAALTQTGVGKYNYVVTPTTPGVWGYRWEGTGGVSAAGEYCFEVQPSRFSVITPIATGGAAGHAVCHGSSD